MATNAPSMSTPLSNLPQATAAPGNVRHDEDQIVNDVINEMQQKQMKPQGGGGGSIPVSVPPMQVPPEAHVIQQYMLPTYAPPPPQQDKLFNILDKTIATRAFVAALVALVLFYPESLGGVYAKVPGIGAHLEQYDKLVRAVLLAVLLYVIMWKLEI
jgi:hypothetical protein